MREQGFVDVKWADGKALNDTARSLNAEGWQIIGVYDLGHSDENVVTLFIQRAVDGEVRT